MDENEIKVMIMKLIQTRKLLLQIKGIKKKIQRKEEKNKKRGARFGKMGNTNSLMPRGESAASRGGLRSAMKGHNADDVSGFDVESRASGASRQKHGKKKVTAKVVPMPESGSMESISDRG